MVSGFSLKPIHWNNPKNEGNDRDIPNIPDQHASKPPVIGHVLMTGSNPSDLAEL
jgi:hypothetical protein